jgi:phosphohistidine swiveling domain-containing protein
MKWLPIWLENNPSLSKKFFSEIKLAVSARKISEKTLPQGRELCNLICNIIEKRFSNLKGCSRFIDYNELKGLLLNDKAPNLKKIKSRTNGFIYSKKGTLNTGNELKKIKETFNKLGYSHNFTLTSNIKEFGGQSAFLGCVRGTVKLIMVKKEIMDIKNGEVLVTSMTTPEYLPAMKKSIAFITDEGGITCHAAIIAREMRKPCIIGTKIATQILKSGDKVEVDADKGIVKILN